MRAHFFPYFPDSSPNSLQKLPFCQLWRGTSPPVEAHDHQPLTPSANAAPPLRPRLHFPHCPHSPLPWAKKQSSAHVFLKPFLSNRPSGQPAWEEGGRRQQPPPSCAFPCSSGRHHRPSEHRPSRHAKGSVNPFITLQLYSLFTKSTQKRENMV